MGYPRAEDAPTLSRERNAIRQKRLSSRPLTPMPGGGVARLDRLIRPRSVAIVGASDEPGTMAAATLANLERCRFTGAIHLVSRRRTEIAGRACLASIDDLPQGTDVAILVVPQSVVLDAIAACGRRGIGAAIVYASGFAEVGAEGRAAQEHLGEAARAANVAVLGPNCIGLINLVDGIPLSFEPNVQPADAGLRPSIGIVAQSGALAVIMRAAFNAKGLGLSHAISTGNEADLTAEDFLAFLIDDAHTRVIALFIEQVRRPADFLKLAARARQAGKPIVLMHPGRSRRAQASASSHTGALAGNRAVMTALLRHEAVIQVDTMEELIDTAELFARLKPPVEGPGIITNSGAVKGFALDFADQVGLDIPTLAPQTLQTLKAILPPFASIENPVDVTAQVIRDVFLWTETANALLADPGVGSLCVPLVAGAPKSAMDKVNALLPAIEAGGKPAVIAILGDEAPVPAEFVAAFRDHGIPVLRSPERALRALAHATAYGKALSAGHDRAPPGHFEIPAAPCGELTEYAAKAYLSRIGVPVARNILVHDLQSAQESARLIGYPVALKAQAAGLAHKSDVGGVMLAISNDDALGQAWRRLEQNLAGHVPSFAVLVERMADPGIEMIVGAKREPGWGPVVMVGLDGIWTEALDDVRLMPADLSGAAIVEEIRRLKGARLLDGMRGAPPADVDALAEVVARIGAVMRTQPHVTEIDVNPLVVYPRGQGVLALDALIVTEGEPPA